VRVLLIIVAVFVVVGLVVLEGIMPRMKAVSDLRSEIIYSAVSTVEVAYPKRGASVEEIVLLVNIKLYMDASIYARTNGYLRNWTADIGVHVKAGQLLAEIDIFEIDHQV